MAEVGQREPRVNREFRSVKYCVTAFCEVRRTLEVRLLDFASGADARHGRATLTRASARSRIPFQIA